MEARCLDEAQPFGAVEHHRSVTILHPKHELPIKGMLKWLETRPEIEYVQLAIDTKLGWKVETLFV